MTSDVTTRPATPGLVAPSVPVLLGAYAARSCPVKTQNAYDPTVERVPAEANDGLAELFDGGSAFEAITLEQLIASCRGRVVDLRLLREERAAVRVEACLRAMASGARVIIGGLLPPDPHGHRVGCPDLLVRGAETAAGTPGYHPVVVKWHKIIERARRLVGDGDVPRGLPYSTLTEPSPGARLELPEHALRVSSRSADFLQLAHYVRMLQACGFAPDEVLGGVIGTDELFEHPVIAWADLDEPLVRTFSRSRPEGWRLRSLLERYDHEQAFRVDIATAASQQTGDRLTSPPLLVRPIVNAECGRCQWWEHCVPQLPPDDVSRRIDKAPLDMREIATLRQHGIATITDLVDADLDELLSWYLPEVTHRTGAESRLRLALRRARMLVAGTSFTRESHGPIAVPAADLEIDLDIESSTDGRVYLWGFLVQRVGQPERVYQEFSRFADLDDQTEAALAVDAFTWLRSVVESGETVAVYHYSGYEVAKICALAERQAEPLLRWAADYAQDHFVDLLEIVKAHYFGVGGLGLKLVAQQAGFRWRDDDPGGLNSQLWFAESVHAETAQAGQQARIRVLEYNEDDVIATSQVRAWLRAQ
jgi:predicted RecB family nuclease